MNLFTQTINDMDSGDLAPALDEELSNLVANVFAMGRKGTMTIKLTIKPAKKQGRVIVVSEFKATQPKTEPGMGIYFATESGQLLKRDPNQMELPFGKPTAVPDEDEDDLEAAM